MKKLLEFQTSDGKATVLVSMIAAVVQLSKSALNPEQGSCIWLKNDLKPFYAKDTYEEVIKMWQEGLHYDSDS